MNHIQSKNKKEFLSLNTRLVVFSYLDLLSIINVSSKLSKRDRDCQRNSTLLNQRMGLRITPLKNQIIDIDNLSYAMGISQFLELNAEHNLTENFSIFHLIIKQAQKLRRPVKLIIRNFEGFDDKYFREENQFILSNIYGLEIWINSRVDNHNQKLRNMVKLIGSVKFLEIRKIDHIDGDLFQGLDDEQAHKIEDLVLDGNRNRAQRDLLTNFRNLRSLNFVYS